MKKLGLIKGLAALTACGLIVGCGGGEETNAAPEPVAASPADDSAPAAKKSSSPAKKKTGSQSLTQKVDAALDRGDYVAATDLVLKTKQDPVDQRANILMVQQAIADGLATGDPNAIKANQTMNRVRLMRMNQGR